MDYVVFDLEWNQGNTGKEGEVKGVPFEIIEIGAVKLNGDLEMTGQFNRLVKPQIYHELNYVTRDLIHLNMEELENGQYFPEVVRDFLEWCGEYLGSHGFAGTPKKYEVLRDGFVRGRTGKIL